MDWQGWITFGFVATVALTGIVATAQMLGWSRFDLPLMLGTLLTPRPALARTVGLAVHLLVGQVFALLYASAFALLGRAGWWLGALFGLGHGLAALLVLIPFLAGIHPRMATERSGPELLVGLEPPGLLALNYGTQTPAITLFSHVVYGALLGSLLGPR